MGIFRLQVSHPVHEDEFLVVYTRTSAVIKQVMTRARREGYKTEDNYTELADFDGAEDAMRTILHHMPLK